VRLVVPGEPVALQRHRVRRTPQGIRSYSPAANVEYAERVRVAWLQAGRPSFDPGEPLTLSAYFWLPRPKSHYRTGRYMSMLREDAPQSPVGKPDVDNFVKAVLDAGSGCIWADDAQVVCLSGVAKCYADDQGTRAVIDVWRAAGPV
jgi:crossover junction endodeoxyribonuclease RusA